MKEKIKNLLNIFRSSKILPSNNVMEMFYFLIVDLFFNYKDFSFSQLKIFNFLVEFGYVKRKFFSDRIVFKNLILFDYIIYTFGDKGIARGTSFNRSEALGKCLGEIIERIPFRRANFYPRDLTTSLNQLKKEKKRYFDFELLPKATKKQKDLDSRLNYNEDSIFEWSEVLSYAKKHFLYIPKQLLYWDFYSKTPEKILRELNTNGLASSYSEEGAIKSALFECLQRHIFFSAWYFPEKNIVTEVDLESIFSVHKNLKVLYEDIAVNMLEYRIFRIKSNISDVFEVYFCIINNKITEGVYLGCSGGDDTYLTIERSIQEALSIYTFTNRALYNGEGLPSYVNVETNNFASGIEGNHRVIWWGHFLDEEAKNILSFFLGSSKEKYIQKKLKKKILFETVVREFGDFFYRVSEHHINKIITHYSVVVVLPNSYTLTLKESIATPVLNEMYPQNTKAHPFP
ncbi:MAG: YcaO-like family protein [Candidatus Pacebacteria bacterium]|nr:YcaO-like family protein [Candidatus Paceibacterota bacterium]